MSYLENEESSPYVYWTVRAAEKEQYDGWVGSLTMEAFLQDINTAADQLLTHAPFLLDIVNNQGEVTYCREFRINTYTAERFYLYAVDGLPRFLLRKDRQGQLREITEEQMSPGELDFGISLSTFLAYNELFTPFDHSLGGCKPAYSMYVVLNMFTARIKLDAAMISGEERYLSVAELALLAGMKETSVRNVLKKDLGIEFDAEREITAIPASRATQWLKGRRKFKPSYELTTEYCRKLLCEVQDDFFS